MPEQAQPAPRTFVLVHGSWHGGWCWSRVARILERHGHKVYTPTLTGLGTDISGYDVVTGVDGVAHARSNTTICLFLRPRQTLISLQPRLLRQGDCLP